MALAATLAACAASAQRDYDPVKPGSGTWRFEGHQTPFGKVTISINGQPVLAGSVSILSGEGSLAGTYDGHTVAAECSKPRGSEARTQCAITVDGEKATSLYFRVK
jgi:hypothetical protein